MLRTSRETASTARRTATVSSGPPHRDQNVACRFIHVPVRFASPRAERRSVMGRPPAASRPKSGCSMSVILAGEDGQESSGGRAGLALAHIGPASVRPGETGRVLLGLGGPVGAVLDPELLHLGELLAPERLLLVEAAALGHLVPFARRVVERILGRLALGQRLGDLEG